MSSPDTPMIEAHPAALLLPAFVNGTLADHERRYVAEHVSTCAQCRRELHECQEVGEQLRGVYACEQGPSPALWRMVKERIAREPAQDRRLRWLGGFDDALRALLRAPLAPTLAAAVLVAQFGVLAWLLGRPERTPDDPVTSRSVAPAATRLRVAFQPQSTAQDVAALLRDLGGRVVDGPSEQGVYTIEVPVAGAAALERLRRRTDLVRSVEALAP